ncbi:MAG: DNA adenine methylase, partial [Magnetococcales bacterium]|nr:DNA adenine methylase [Magnetococcales bacterium]
MLQLNLFSNQVTFASMPSTRFQGSKRKYLPFLANLFADYEFKTCLDAFGGTGSVTHLLLSMGKDVLYNDILKANYVNAKALFIEGGMRLGVDELKSLFQKKDGVDYKQHISDIYDNIFYTKFENEQIDVITQNILSIEDEIKKSEAFYCLFQTALIKRPYNLFHRANLSMREQNVQRSFGNKKTWDTPIELHMIKFYRELQEYKAIQKPGKCYFANDDAFE